MSPLDILIGRQPVFYESGEIYAYELLLRDAGLPNVAPASPLDPYANDGGLRPEGVLKLVDVGIERLVGDHKFQLKVHPSLLTSDAWRVFPPERSIFVLKSSFAGDPLLLESCRTIASEGYSIAVDQLALDPTAAGLFELAQIVTFNVGDLDKSPVGYPAMHCISRGKVPSVSGINQKEQLDDCALLGFQLFQGYLLSLPQVVDGRTLKGNKLSQLRLAASLLNAETDIKELEEIVRLDPSMARQILQLAGATSGVRRKVKTIREALVLAGWRRLQSWVTLLMLADDEDTTEEELATCLVRARMCELVAKTMAPESADLAYTAGMLSSFDLLLKVDLDTALAAMPLGDELLSAVSRHEGTVGGVVSDVIEYQKGNFGEGERSGATTSDLQGAIADALIWAVEATSVGRG